MLDIIGVGDTNIDLFVKVDHIPSHDEKVKGTLLGKLPGGIIGNFCCAAAKFGAATGIVAKVGQDEYGKLCIEDLARRGVDITGMVIKEDADTYFCFIHLDNTGEKALTIVETSGFLPKKEEIRVDYLRTAKYVHMTTLDVDLANYVFDQLNGHDCTLSLDIEATASKANPDTWKSLLQKVDIAFPNEAGLYALTKADQISRGAQILLDSGVKMVVVTCGERGVKVFTDRFQYEHPIYRVAVKDTTGAGDCFNAVYLVCLSKGWDIQTAARYASAAAAISIQAVGARAGLPTIEDVEKFLAEYQDWS